MDPSGRPRSIPDGATCTACGAPVPTGRIRILATRDDLAFVELVCDDCGSAALGLLLDRADRTTARSSTSPPTVPRHRPRSSSAGRGRPIDAADVEALRLDLAAWQGDLVGWLDAIGAARARDGAGPVSVPFAHASEAEMSRILDFYAVRWEYEPDTFPILWNLDGDVIESFSPDFYLPDLDLYLEMTTLRQKLVRRKNRKLRRLRELYPDLNVKLFYARDFRALMLKYGKLALADGLSGTSGQVAAPYGAHGPTDGRRCSARARHRPARDQRPGGRDRRPDPAAPPRAGGRPDPERDTRMSETANLHGDVGEILLTEEEIDAKVRELGARISADYRGRRLTLVSVLKGSLPFMADLMRAIDIPVRIDLMEVSSYGGSATESSGLVRILKDLSASIADEDVLIVEDIIDTGLTLNYLVRYLRGKAPASLRICTLLDKPARRLVEIPVDYTGFTIPDQFVVGYGLDYGELYRNLRYVGVLKPEVYTEVPGG